MSMILDCMLLGPAHCCIILVLNRVDGPIGLVNLIQVVKNL